MEKDLKEIESGKIEKKVYRLRHRDGLDWHDISSKVNEEFKKAVNSTQVEEIYDNHVARALVINNTNKNRVKEATKVTESWVKEVKQIIKKIKTVSLAHYDIANKKLLELAKEDNPDKYFDNLPAMVSVSRSLLDQAKFLGDKISKVEITQNKLVLNETQILQIVNNAYAQKEKDTGYFIHPGRNRLEHIKDRR